VFHGRLTFNDGMPAMMTDVALGDIWKNLRGYFSDDIWKIAGHNSMWFLVESRFEEVRGTSKTIRSNESSYWYNIFGLVLV
jgi:hypothetical protein